MTFLHLIIIANLVRWKTLSLSHCVLFEEDEIGVKKRYCLCVPIGFQFRQCKVGNASESLLRWQCTLYGFGQWNTAAILLFRFTAYALVLVHCPRSSPLTVLRCTLLRLGTVCEVSYRTRFLSPLVGSRITYYVLLKQD